MCLTHKDNFHSRNNTRPISYNKFIERLTTNLRIVNLPLIINLTLFLIQAIGFTLGQKFQQDKAGSQTEMDERETDHVSELDK